MSRPTLVFNKIVPTVGNPTVTLNRQGYPGQPRCGQPRRGRVPAPITRWHGPLGGVRRRGIKAPNCWGGLACGPSPARPLCGLLKGSLPRGRAQELKSTAAGLALLPWPEAEGGGCPAGLVLGVAPRGPTIGGPQFGARTDPALARATPWRCCLQGSRGKQHWTIKYIWLSLDS